MISSPVRFSVRLKRLTALGGAAIKDGLQATVLAKTRNLPLLFKGNDFARTDLIAAS